MATDSRTSNDESFSTNYSVENFNGRFTRHEYLRSEGIIELDGETYRIRINEHDDHLYIDAWKGEYDGRSFEPEEYKNDVRVYVEEPSAEVPSHLEQVDRILDAKRRDTKNVGELIEQAS